MFFTKLSSNLRYVGKNMKDAHQNMRLTNTEFDVTVEHLINTLKDMNVNAAVIAEISKLVETLRKDIVFAGTLTIYE
jgi:truncated hemoglobin YjbI